VAPHHVHGLVLKENAPEIRDLGRVPYAEALSLQRSLVDERADGRRGDIVLVCEHEPVITVGRRGPGGGTFRPPRGIAVVEVERGGEATYHGPGQAVVYPIVLLPEGRRDLHAFLRGLEEATIETLAGFGVAGERVAGKTGVWIAGGGKKVASIGVAVRRWVTYHGVALNVAADLSGFAGFAPCGLPPEIMANVGPSLPRGIGRSEVAARLAAAVARRVASG